MSVFATPAGAAATTAATGNENAAVVIDMNSRTPIVLTGDGGGQEFAFTAETDGPVRIFSDNLNSNDVDQLYITVYDSAFNELASAEDHTQTYLECDTVSGDMYYIFTGFADGFSSGSYDLCLYDKYHSFDTIAPGQTKTVSIATNDEICYLKYTAEASAKVRFYSGNYNDTYGYLFDANLSCLTSNDDGGNDNNFSISYELQEGETYYFGAGFFSGYGTGDITVTLEYLPLPEDTPDVYIGQDTVINIGKTGSHFVKLCPQEDFYGNVGISNEDQIRGFIFYLNIYNSYFEEVYPERATDSYSNGSQFGYSVINVHFYQGETYYLYVNTDLSDLDDGVAVPFTFRFDEAEKLQNPEDAEPISLNEDKVIVNDQEGSGIKLFSFTADTYTDVYMYVKDFSDSIQNPYVDVTVYDSNLYALRSYSEIRATDVKSVYCADGQTYYFAVRLIESQYQEGSYTFCLSDLYINPRVAIMKATAEDIFIGDTKTAHIATNDEVAYYKFVPEEETVIEFFSTGSDDTYGQIYDAGGYEIYSDDDGGEGYNFRIALMVEAGETYYLGAKYLSDYRTGDFDVHLIETPKPHTVDGYTYLPNYDGTTAALQSYSGSAENIVIPDEIDGYRITSIDYEAFSGNQAVKSITVPNSVLDIHAYAFAECTNLESLTIGANVRYIDNTVARACSGLRSITVDPANTVFDSRNSCNAIINTYENTLIIGCAGTTIPNDIDMIGNYAFSDCTGMTELVIPDNISEIGFGAFRNCSGITSIAFGKNLQSIPAACFANCTALTSVEIPANIRGIGSRAFESCTMLADVTLHEQSYIADTAFINTPWYNSLSDGIIYSGTTAVGYKGELPEDAVITFRDDTTAIGDDFLSNRVDISNIVKVIIPDSVTEIGSYAFAYCQNLSEVVMSKNIEMVGNYCFQNTPWLNAQPDGVLYFGKVAYRFIDSNNTRSSYDSAAPVEEKTVTIKEGTTVIAAGFARLNKNITKVALPDSIELIGEYAFCNCSNLQEINTPSELREIGAYGFADCYNLPDAVLNGKMQTVEPYTFSNCVSFNNVNIPNGVTDIAYSAFQNCNSLFALEMPATLEHIGDQAFSSCNLQQLVFPENMGYIDNAAFWRNNNLNSVSFNDSIKIIGDYAFGSCDLNAVSLPKDLERIGTRAFGYWIYGYFRNDQTEIEWDKQYDFTVIGYSDTEAERYAYNNDFTFIDPNKLENAKQLYLNVTEEASQAPGDTDFYRFIPDEDIEAQLIINCTNQTGYMMRSIMDSRFNTLESRQYWDGVTYDLKAGETYYISTNSVVDSETITQVNYDVTLRSVKTGSYISYTSDNHVLQIFSYTGDETDVKVPDTIDDMSVVSLSYGAFRNCSDLRSVTMPKELISVGVSAFRDCTDLESVTLNEGLAQIETDAFINCTNLKSITIPSSVERIYSWALGYTDGGRHNYQPIPGFTIYGYKGTAAEEYADENGFAFVPLDDLNIITDEQTGIVVETAEDDVRLLIEEVTDPGTLDHAKIAVGSDGTLDTVYDITLTRDDIEVQPDGRVTVRIPCEDPNAKVYRLEVNGAATNMNAVYVNGCLTFTTDHFSLYAVVVPKASPKGYLLGDVDDSGEVDLVDATLIQRYASDLRVNLTEEQIMQGDVDSSGETDIVDAAFIQRYATELRVDLPIGKYFEA